MGEIKTFSLVVRVATVATVATDLVTDVTDVFRNNNK